MDKKSQKLWEQSELLSSIFDTVPCGIIRMKGRKGDYELSLINPAAIRFLGYEEDEVYGRSWASGVADTVIDTDILLDSYEKLRKPGDRVQIEYRVRHKDGSIHWLRGSNYLVDIVDGVRTIQRMIIEVTKGKILEEQLRNDREMYRLAMESSSDYLYEYVSEHDVFTLYTPIAAEMGIDNVNRLVVTECQKRFSEIEIIHPADLQMVIDNICKGGVKTFEFRMQLFGEEYHWCRATGKLVENKDGTWRVVGTIRDIHSEKQEQDDSRREIRMNHAALNAISGTYRNIYFVDIQEDAFYPLNLPGMNLEVVSERSGSFQQQMRRYVEKGVEENDRERLQEFISYNRLREVLHKINENVYMEYKEKTNQKFNWIRMDVHVASVENKVVRNVVVTLRNVTEERERELFVQQEEQKAKKALEEAYQSARSASFAKSDFLSKMSHDIRTPMNAIIGMGELARRNVGDTQKTLECLEKMQASSEHLLGLLNEVLDMSKIESGKVELNEAPFNIRELLEECVEIMRMDSSRKHQELNVDIHGLDVEEVLGDEMRVKQILLNLISNAVKYTNEGGHICVELGDVLQSERGIACYQIVVEDDGIGMTKEFMDKIFQPFERAEDSRVSKTQGTGLGMAITQNLVHMMNGTIEIESEPDKGTKFTVTIYLKLSKNNGGSVEEKKKGRKAHKRKNIEHDRKDWKILVVEDNDINREIVHELLNMEGIYVEEAVDGKDAVEKFSESPCGYFDAILMDLQMPVMNGYDAAKAIRKSARKDARTVPIIALTANAFTDDIFQVKKAGMNLHLAKPLNVESMLEALEELIEKK